MKIALFGLHESGRELPEIEIDAAELAAFNWLPNLWGMDCILEVGKGTKEHVRYAAQTTARHAERQTVYTVTGWRKIDGQWVFLLPGNEEYTVSLSNKLHGYNMAEEASGLDLAILTRLLTAGPVTEIILFPLLALVFLSPLNHFLKLANCEPKFVLFLIGRTGTRKSSLAALMLSFFGSFTATNLPMSFQDTANSIAYNSFAMKDVLTCIDDFHPATRYEEQKQTATPQIVLRVYGDRAAKGRLRSDCSPMEAGPPQGNAIITAEFPPDIGESGTARYLALELKPQDVDLDVLTYFQNQAAEGVLARCMRSYLEWLKKSYLMNPDAPVGLLLLLKDNFRRYREAFRRSRIPCHGRVAETVAWLQIGIIPRMKNQWLNPMTDKDHLIWSDDSLDYEDWRADLEDEFPDLTDDERFTLMCERNADYLDDERRNLNIRLGQPILVIGDLGLWYGRRSGYKEIPSGNIRDCLYSDCDYNTCPTPPCSTVWTAEQPLRSRSPTGT